MPRPFFFAVFILLSSVLPPASRAGENDCRSRALGAIRLPNGAMIPEVSGIARRAPGDVYLVSDSNSLLYHARRRGGAWSVDSYGIDTAGSGPNRAPVIDIEDVAYGPCPVRSEGRCIFIGEMGGKGHRTGRNAFNIHYMRERDLAGMSGRYVRTSKLQYRYPGGGRFDAEGLAVHPVTGDLFVVTKTRGSTSYIYRLDPRFPADEPTVAATLDLQRLFGFFGNTNARQITGLTISPDGMRFTVVTYEALMEFGMDLSGPGGRGLPDDIDHGRIKGRRLSGDWWGAGRDIRGVQVESIAYDGYGMSFLVIGEGDPALLALDCASRVVKDGSGSRPKVMSRNCRVDEYVGNSSIYLFLFRSAERDYTGRPVTAYSIVGSDYDDVNRLLKDSRVRRMDPSREMIGRYPSYGAAKAAALRLCAR